tara:strand:+ start:761 stop:925 length:165 start_codon:yes stop_codon:yes gene_type:complete
MLLERKIAVVYAFTLREKFSFLKELSTTLDALHLFAKKTNPAKKPMPYDRCMIK